MKRMLIALVVLGLSGAACEEEIAPPEIYLEVSPVNCGPRSTAADLSAYDFDIMLYNVGEETLLISEVVERGDSNCAFEFEGPDLLKLGENQATFIRGRYKPTVEGDDQIALEISSNSQVHDPLIIPVCGRGIAPGKEDDGPPLQCNVPPQDQPGCPGDE